MLDSIILWGRINDGLVFSKKSFSNIKYRLFWYLKKYAQKLCIASAFGLMGLCVGSYFTYLQLNQQLRYCQEKINSYKNRLKSRGDLFVDIDFETLKRIDDRFQLRKQLKNKEN